MCGLRRGAQGGLAPKTQKGLDKYRHFSLCLIQPIISNE